jgi:hypothetical protein
LCDSIIYKTIKDESDTHKLQEDLDAAAKWENDWLMQFHPDKTFRLRLIKLRCLLAVELMLSKCLFHLRSDWIVTPRYFVEDSVWRVC